MTILALTVAMGFGSGAFAADGVNLVAIRNGAQVIKFTSQLDGGGRADQLIDEHEGSGGWAAGDNSLPQEIIFRLPAVLRFNTLVFRLGTESPDRRGAKDIAVYTAELFPTMGGWKLLTEVQLGAQPGDQIFAVPPTDGRFIRLVIGSGQSAPGERVSLDTFKLYNR